MLEVIITFVAIALVIWLVIAVFGSVSNFLVKDIQPLEDHDKKDI